MNASQKYILAPVDLPEPNKHALDAAVNVSITFNLPLKLVHVISTPLDAPLTPLDDVNFEGMPRTIDSLIKDAEDRLFKLSSELSKNFTMPAGVVYEVHVGNVADTLITMTKENNPEWTVIASASHRSFMDRWIGNLSTDVAELTNTPTMIIPDNPHPVTPKHIAYVANAERENHAGLGAVAKLARKYDAVLQVIEFSDEISSELLEQRFKKEETLRALLRLPNLMYSLEKGDDIKSVLHDKIHGGFADMVVMHHQEQNLLQKLFNGDATKDIILETENPLVVL